MGGGGKTKTYVDLNIEPVYPNIRGTDVFRKKLVTAKAQTQNNLNTIKSLINFKSNIISIPKLKKLGFISQANGKIHTLTKEQLALYIAYITNDSDINILYDVYRIYKYQIYFKFLHDIYLPLHAYTDIYTYSFYNIYTSEDDLSELKICGKSEGKIDTSVIDSHKNNLNTENTDYCLKLVDVYDDSYKNSKFKTIDNIDWKIQLWLENNYSKKEKDQKTVIYNYYGLNYDITYNSYNIKDDKYYKAIIKDNSIERKVEDDEIKIHLVNVNDSDDDIWVTWPQDLSVLYVAKYTSYKHSKPTLNIGYYDKALTFINELHFFTIPIKSSGSMVTQTNFTKLWLNQVGLTLPDNYNNSDIKDVLFSLTSSYNPKEYPNLRTSMQAVYGTKHNKRNVIVDSGVGVYEYYWEVDYTTNRIKRKLNVNGYKFYDIEDSNYNDTSLIEVEQRFNNSFMYISSGGSYGDGNQLIRNTEDNIYFIPIEILQKTPMNEFFNIYYTYLNSLIFTKKTIKLKWYQTFLFQFVLQAIGLFAAAFTGGASGVIIFILTNVAVQLIMDSNLSPELKVALSTAIVIATGQINNVTSTTSSTISTGSALTLSGSEMMNVTSTAIKDYTTYNTLKEQQKINKKTKEVQTLNNEIKELSDKIQTQLNNSININLNNNFDSNYELLYSDPMKAQDVIAYSYLDSIISPIDQIYN